MARMAKVIQLALGPGQVFACVTSAERLTRNKSFSGR